MKLALRIMTGILSIGMIFSAVLTAHAQTEPKAPPSAQPAPSAPSLSEVERLRLENIQLKFTNDQTAIQQIQKELETLRAQYQAEVAEVEKAHPGFTVGNDGKLTEKPKAAAKSEPVK